MTAQIPWQLVLCILVSAPVVALGDTASTADSGTTVQAIINGDQETETRPWMAALLRKSASSTTAASELQFCGGTLIDKDWVVTAAHCVDKVTPTSIHVLLGKLNLDEGGGEDIGVSEIIVHPFWDSENYVNDVALVRLEQASANTPISIHTDANNSSLDGSSATALGWGQTFVDIDDSECTLSFADQNADLSNYRCELITVTPPAPDTPNLMRSELSILGNSACNNAFNAFLASTGSEETNESLVPEEETSSTVLCVRHPQGNSGVCFGDSGGPLIVNKEGQAFLAGIASLVVSKPGCDPVLGISIFTKAAYFRDFVLDAIQHNKAYSFASYCSPAISAAVSFGNVSEGKVKTTISWNAVENASKYVLRYQSYPDTNLFAGAVDLSPDATNVTVDLDSGAIFHVSLQGFNSQCNGPISRQLRVAVP